MMNSEMHSHRLNKYLKTYEERAQEIAHGLVPWLQYELLVDRECLLSERSLAQPIGQLLAATGKPPIRPEYPHPSLKNAKIDFVHVRRLAKSKEEILLAVETKFLNGNSKRSGSEVANDIARLAMVIKTVPSARAWLLIAGRKKRFVENNSTMKLANVKSEQGISTYLPGIGDAKHRKEAQFTFIQPPTKSKYWANEQRSLKVRVTLLIGYDLDEIQLAVKKRDPNVGGMACYIWEVACLNS